MDQFAGPCTRIVDLVGLDWNLRICIFNKFSGYTHAAGPGTTFCELLLQTNRLRREERQTGEEKEGSEALCTMSGNIKGEHSSGAPTEHQSSRKTCPLSTSYFPD